MRTLRNSEINIPSVWIIHGRGVVSGRFRLSSYRSSCVGGLLRRNRFTIKIQKNLYSSGGLVTHDRTLGWLIDIISPASYTTPSSPSHPYLVSPKGLVFVESFCPKSARQKIPIPPIAYSTFYGCCQMSSVLMHSVSS